MRWIILITWCCVLGACTPMEWRRDGEVASFEGNEYQQCRNRAFLDSMRQMPFHSISPYPIVGADRFGRPVFISRPWSHMDQLMLEHMSMNQCMATLGFRLVPIVPVSPNLLPAEPKLDPGSKGS